MRSPSRGNLIVSVCVFISLYCIYRYTRLKYTCDWETNTSQWKATFTSINICIQQGIRKVKFGELWQKLHLVVDECSKNAFRLLNVTLLRNWDDAKGFIEYSSEAESSSCTLVTLGIGGDIKAEEKLLAKVPKCRLFGADPIPDSGQLYSRIGQYFNVAVAAESGNLTASVLEKSAYKLKAVDHVNFVDFIHNYAKISTVEHLWLDAEGAEYKLLPQLQVGMEVETAGISVCLISAELHGPVKHYGLNLTDWDLIVRNFLLMSNFIPLWTPPPQNHHRLFLVNWKNPICVHKYNRF